MLKKNNQVNTIDSEDSEVNINTQQQAHCNCSCYLARIELNKKSYKPVEKKINLESFLDIESKFFLYIKCFGLLLLIYIVIYVVWLLISNKILIPIIGNAEKSRNIKFFLNLVGNVMIGIMYVLDGFIISYLKTPFNLMCYAVNKSDLKSEQKNFFIKKATESSEHCKDTFKKFGIFTITKELSDVFIKSLVNEKVASDISNNIDAKKIKKNGDPEFWFLSYIGYIIPMLFSLYSLYQFHIKLEEIKSFLNKTKEEILINENVKTNY